MFSTRPPSGSQPRCQRFALTVACLNGKIIQGGNPQLTLKDVQSPKSLASSPNILVHAGQHAQERVRIDLLDFIPSHTRRGTNQQDMVKLYPSQGQLVFAYTKANHKCSLEVTMQLRDDFGTLVRSLMDLHIPYTVEEEFQRQSLRMFSNASPELMPYGGYQIVPVCSPPLFMVPNRPSQMRRPASTQGFYRGSHMTRPASTLGFDEGSVPRSIVSSLGFSQNASFRSAHETLPTRAPLGTKRPLSIEDPDFLEEARSVRYRTGPVSQPCTLQGIDEDGVEDVDDEDGKDDDASALAVMKIFCQFHKEVVQLRADALEKCNADRESKPTTRQNERSAHYARHGVERAVRLSELCYATTSKIRDVMRKRR